LLICGEARPLFFQEANELNSSQKPFKTYRQQLSILRKRHLTIKDGTKAIKVLKREGYYNIINGYKGTFIDAQATRQLGEDQYKAGTTFEHLYALYDFDCEMRSILIKYILKMETALKTKIAYIFSENFKQNFSYLDINNYDASDPQKVTNLIARISEVIKYNSGEKIQGGQFFHYLDKYKELPLWILIKKMTLGETYHFFEVLKPSIKDTIVNEFVEEYSKEHSFPFSYSANNRLACFLSVIKFINSFRNICAHDERLFNTIIREKRNNIPHITHFHRQSPTQFKSRLFDCILLLGFFLPKKDYVRLISQISSEVDDLNKKLPSKFYNDVLIQMGFARDWKTKIQLP